MTEGATAGDTTDLPARGAGRVGPFERIERGLAAACLAVMAVLPVAEILARTLLGRGIPGSGPLVQHLTLWVAFLGAALAAREGRLIALSTGNFLPARVRAPARAFAFGVGTLVSLLLARGGWDLLAVERMAETRMALGIPVWMVQAVLPVAFVAIALRLVWTAGGRWARAGAALGLGLGLWAALRPELLEGRNPLPALIVLGVATLLGMPLFATLGGAAAVLFLADFDPLAGIPAETYSLTVSPTLASIPLFTLAGFLLAEGRASQRLVDVFRGLVGWMPGGTAVVAAAVCAFFTAFTGGSGVTILALGALLLQALAAEGYRERFSLGLLTASGSLGLLFPPAVPLIVYGIVAQVPIEDLFLAGLVPGALLVAMVAGWGVHEGWKTGIPRTRFRPEVAARALWTAKWELLLPLVLLVTILRGWATPVEAASIAVVYALVLQAAIHRDLGWKDLFRVLDRCTVLLGGILIILGVAKGLASWMVLAQIPMQALEWVQGHVGSRILFLLGLNLFLLAIGCLMDIFSAIVVVVPLIVPLGNAFGIDPLHLGILFVANLELGYLTPPVGLNLFIASYRFEKPLLGICRATLPMLAILGVGVLLITYVPELSLALPRFLGR